MGNSVEDKVQLEWNALPNGAKYRRDPDNPRYGWVLCPDCAKERYRIISREGTVPFQHFTGRCSSCGCTRGQQRRVDARRGRIVRLSDGGIARRDTEDPRYGWVACPDCPEPKKERRVIIPSNAERLQNFTGRCHRHGVAHRKKLKGRLRHPSGAYFLFDKLDGIEDPNVCVWVECPNPDKNLNCEGEYIGWKYNWYRQKVPCLCGSCVSAPGRGHRSRLITDNLDLFDGPGGTSGTLILYAQGDEQGKIPVKYRLCGDIIRFPRDSIRSRLHAHKTGKQPWPSCCKPCSARPADVIERLAQATIGNGNGKQRDDVLQKLLEAVGAVAVAWAQVRGGAGSLEHRLKKIDLLVIGSELGVPLDPYDDVKSRNRVTRKLTSRP